MQPKKRPEFAIGSKQDYTYTDEISIDIFTDYHWVNAGSGAKQEQKGAEII